jgi:hypothetical protein
MGGLPRGIELGKGLASKRWKNSGYSRKNLISEEPLSQKATLILHAFEQGKFLTNCMQTR